MKSVNRLQKRKRPSPETETSPFRDTVARFRTFSDIFLKG